MSCRIREDTLDSSKKEQIHNDLTVKLEDNKYAKGAPARYVYAYNITDDYLTVPFSYGCMDLRLTRPARDKFSRMSAVFTGTLRSEQMVVRSEAIKTLEKTGSVIMSMYCGFGKTICAINLACAIRFKTLIFVNKVVLMKQWADSIQAFCPSAVIQKLTPKSVIKEADFYIINAINTVKRCHEFQDIGTVIVDESHLIMAETLSRCMEHVHPRYLIGLTATPYQAGWVRQAYYIVFRKQ